MQLIQILSIFGKTLMTRLIKISLKVGSITAVAIALYELSLVLFNYHYLRYEYYITGVGLAALITGIVVTNKYHLYRKKNISANLPDQLTTKERRIMELINEGKSNKEIAALNFIEISTVKTHINNIYCKLGVKNRKEAVQVCRDRFSLPKSTHYPPLEI